MLVFSLLASVSSRKLLKSPSSGTKLSTSTLPDVRTVAALILLAGLTEATVGPGLEGVAVVHVLLEKDIWEFGVVNEGVLVRSTVLEGCPATIEADGAGAACSAAALLLFVKLSENNW